MIYKLSRLKEADKKRKKTQRLNDKMKSLKRRGYYIPIASMIFLKMRLKYSNRSPHGISTFTTNTFVELPQKETYRIHEKRPKLHDYSTSIPPRTGKSYIVSICSNAWVWGCINPYLSFVTVSHTESLATELSFKTKQLIESDWYTTFFPPSLKIIKKMDDVDGRCVDTKFWKTGSHSRLAQSSNYVSIRPTVHIDCTDN